MFKLNIRLSFLIVFCFLIGSHINGQAPALGAKDVIFKMIKSIDELERLKYSLKIIERGKKGFNYYESSVKLSRKPRKIYLYIKGIELLWVSGWNNNKAYVKPNSFPYVNLSLDPLGYLMRQDQHHTLNEMGVDYFGGLIEYMALKNLPKFDTYFKFEGEERINNRPCYKIVIDNKDFAYENYTVGENESITSIARKLHISEYMILLVNPKFKDYFDILKKGQVIVVPNAYAKHVTLFIDQLYFLPISIKILDDKGLYEQYDYHFLQVNPKIDDAEFTKKYKDYKF
jgi:hypothetical protein